MYRLQHGDIDIDATSLNSPEIDHNTAVHAGSAFVDVGRENVTTEIPCLNVEADLALSVAQSKSSNTRGAGVDRWGNFVLPTQIGGQRGGSCPGRQRNNEGE